VLSMGEFGERTLQVLFEMSEHRQPKLTPRESEEFINYLWLSSRAVTFERDLGFGLQAAVNNLKLYMGNKISSISNVK